MHLKNLALASLAPLALLTGCHGPDITIANPLTSASVPVHKIVKEHGYAESQRGVPVGSLSDEATLEAVTKDEVCVTVALHEFSAIDLASAQFKLSNGTAERGVVKVQAEPPASQTYQGLVPHREQTGTHISCKSTADGETNCQSEPVYSDTMIRGAVDVFGTRGRVCTPNDGLIAPDTKELSLKVTVPTSAPGAWGYGHGKKSTTFRWAFQ